MLIPHCKIKTKIDFLDLDRKNVEKADRKRE